MDRGAWRAAVHGVEKSQTLTITHSLAFEAETALCRFVTCGAVSTPNSCIIQGSTVVRDRAQIRSPSSYPPLPSIQQHMSTQICGYTCTPKAPCILQPDVGPDSRCMFKSKLFFSQQYSADFLL